MKKEILFTLGLLFSAAVYSQTARTDVPQLQMSGTTERQKADTVSIATPIPAAMESAGSPATAPPDKPKSESEKKSPMLSSGEPK